MKKNLLLLLITVCLLQQWVPAQTPQIIPAANGSTRLKMNQRFYSNGDMASAKVLFQKVIPVHNLFVVFVSPKTGDAEALPLTKISDLEYATSGTLKINYASGKNPKDGILNVQAGEAIVSYYYAKDFKEQKPSNPQPNQPINPKTNAVKTNAVIAPMYINKQEPDMACDFALIRGTENYLEQFKVNKGYALTKTEAVDKAATVVVQGEMPVQVSNNRVIYYSRNQQELKEFLTETRGILIGTIGQQQQNLTNNLPGNNSGGATHLIEVPANEPNKAQNLADLGQLRNFLGFKQKINASSDEALQVIGFVSLANLDGYAVSLNPRMQFDADFDNNKDDIPVTNNIINPPGAGEDIPGSFTQDRTNIQKVWNYMAIWDKDATRINVAIIDYGYNPNNDYRNLSTVSQCLADATTVRCGINIALGPPTVGAGLFGGRVWHGNAVQARIGGVLNNNFGTAGTGGQVAVPQIIKLSGAEAYAFNIGGAIRQAVANGAHVINISGSFPCRALTSIGDFTYCEPGVRGAICAALFPIVQAGAVAACATAQAIVPLPGVFEICIGATSSAYISACTAQMMLGNPGEVISSAVQFAKANGVPVIACAGNFLTRDDLSGVPEDLRGLVNLDQNLMRVENWNIVPGSLPDVICVGATQPAGNFENAHIWGDRVDIWAPQDGIYIAPTSGDAPAGPSNPDIRHPGFNGTSSSTPFITGLVANAMAINPQLRRGTSSRPTAIVSEIRNMLVSTAWRASDLPTDPTGRRRNLVNPIRFTQAAAFFEGSGVPTFSGTSVYNGNWNVETTEGATSDDATPTVLTFTRGGGIARTGSIIFIPGSGGAANIVDVDRYTINIPPATGTTIAEAITFKLRTPRGFGNLVVRGAGVTLTGTTPIGTNEEEKTFTGPVMRPGSSIAISVEGATPSDDNIYRLSIGNAPVPVTGGIASTVSLTEIGILCPSTLVRGDREFGGPPLINASVVLDITPDGTGIDAIVNFTGQESGGDNSEVRGNWRVRVFNAPDGQRISAITSPTRTNIVNYRGRGGGFEVSIFGCNDGVVEDATLSGGPVRTFSLIADTGGDDISGDNDCRCDSRIQRIAFNPITITMIRL